MVRTRKAVWFVGVLCLLLAAPSGVIAGTTGKVAGRALDAKGEPLPGANVAISGTKRGATTDAQGYYVIVPVEPGVYALTASMVGYNSQKKTDVEVRADFTTEVNFKLTEVAIESSEIVVVAERPPVEVDKTSSKYVVGEGEIEEVPIVRSAQDIVALQPGADVTGEEVLRNSDVHTGLRTAGGNDLIYYVDGIQMTHSTGPGQKQGVGRQIFSGLSKTAVREITVVVGGMEAEYGNAQGGVINVVTKEGSPEYHGWMEYRLTPAGKKHWGANAYEDPIHKDKMRWGNAAWENERDPVTGRLAHERIDYTGVMGHALDMNLSGPFMGNSSFLIAGDWSALASPLPGASARGFELSNGTFIPTTGYFNASYNLTFRPSQSLKVKAGGMLRSLSRWVGQDVGVWTNVGVARGLEDTGRNIFLPSDWSASGKQRMTDHTEYVTITHTLSPRTFYEVRVARSSSTQDTSGIPSRTTDPRRDAAGWFTVGREVRQFELSDRKSYQFKFDFSSQMTRGHFLKAGVDAVKHQIWNTRFTQDTATQRRVEISGKNGISMGKPAGPVVGGAYAQDKMEFEGLVINLGMRLDFLDPSEKVPILPQVAKFPMYESYQRFKNVPLKDPAVLTAWGPRLGVSHPITERSTVHFFVGRFIQWPSLYSLYNQDWQTSSQDADWNKDGRIDENEIFNTTIVSYPPQGGSGNVNFKPESSVNFEVGFDWNFVSDFIVGTTMFYKSLSDQYNNQSAGSFLQGDTKRFSALQVNFIGSSWFEDIRGFEMSLKKRFSQNFSFNVAYNLRWSTRGRGGWFRWDIIPDSTWITTPYEGKPRYWSQWKVENGREVPVYLTDAQMASAGQYLNTYIRDTQKNTSQTIEGAYVYGVAAPMRVYGWTGRDAVDEEHLWVRPRAFSSGINPNQDIRNSGSIQILYATPPDYGPDVKVLGSPILANWQVNLIHRLHTGSNFNYSPPAGQQEVRSRSIRSWTDLHVEKRFPFSRGEVAFFAEAYNLFNQKDSGTSGFEYVQWGLQRPRPDNSDYLKYGDPEDQSRYYGSPREVVFGLRAKF